MLKCNKKIIYYIKILKFKSQKFFIFIFVLNHKNHKNLIWFLFLDSKQKWTYPSEKLIEKTDRIFFYFLFPSLTLI